MRKRQTGGEKQGEDEDHTKVCFHASYFRHIITEINEPSNIPHSE